MGIIQLIASSNFITVNKNLIKELGIDEAILLGQLASEYEYWLKKGELQNEYFYSTIENVEDNTGLSEYRQRKALNNLKDKGIIDTKILGIPAKRYIKINDEQLLEVFQNKSLKNSRTSPLKTQELVPEKFKGNKKDNKKENNTFKAPTLEEVKQYCKERNNNVDADYFYNYFNVSGWVDSKGNKVRNWKQKIITWERYNTTNNDNNSPSPTLVKTEYGGFQLTL